MMRAEGQIWVHRQHHICPWTLDMEDELFFCVRSLCLMAVACCWQSENKPILRAIFRQSNDSINDWFHSIHLGGPAVQRKCDGSIFAGGGKSLTYFQTQTFYSTTTSSHPRRPLVVVPFSLFRSGFSFSFFGFFFFLFVSAVCGGWREEEREMMMKQFLEEVKREKGMQRER